MFYGDVIFGVITFLIGGIFLILSQGFSGGTSDGVPGAGFFPTILSILILISSLLLIIKGIKEKKHYFNIEKGVKSLPENTKKLLITIIALLLFLILWKYVNFIIGIASFILILNHVYGQKFSTNIIYTLSTVICIYLLFGKVFHVML
ncbi:MAG: tripartite tricarboxylate transporter TctB family protein [Sphaerochaetaceae bacterium]|nr:tripartite tricarboxylate transporter TctB family protein [Sphaerochaetaceae bacterium]